jgi:hypothetical protein
MNLLDENIPEQQRQLLRQWRIRTNQIGQDIGRQGMKDDEIVPLLHSLSRPTFFTRDAGFDRREACHPSYCMVWLDLDPDLVASFIQRLLRPRAFRTRAADGPGDARGTTRLAVLAATR